MLFVLLIKAETSNQEFNQNINLNKAPLTVALKNTFFITLSVSLLTFFLKIRGITYKPDSKKVGMSCETQLLKKYFKNIFKFLSVYANSVASSTSKQVGTKSKIHPENCVRLKNNLFGTFHR